MSSTSAPPRGQALLYELELSGGRVGNQAPEERVWTASALTFTADEVIGLAVDPLDCLLYAVLRDGADQILGTVATASEPGGDGEYEVTLEGSIADDDLVDIAFDADGTLYGLEAGGDIVKLDKTDGSKDAAFDVLRSNVGIHLAFDAPDAGFFFVMSENVETGARVDVDVFEPYTAPPATTRCGSSAAGTSEA